MSTIPRFFTYRPKAVIHSEKRCVDILLEIGPEALTSYSAIFHTISSVKDGGVSGSRVLRLCIEVMMAPRAPVGAVFERKKVLQSNFIKRRH